MVPLVNNKFCIQYGITSSVPGNGSATITLPVSFTTAKYKVNCTQLSTSVGHDQNVGIHNLTASQFTCYNGVGSGLQFHYSAIGY